MKTYFAMIATGKSVPNNMGGIFFQGLNSFHQVEAETRVEAFLALYDRLKGTTKEITALKIQGQEHLLGFSADEWSELSKRNDLWISEGYPEREGIQIQAIKDTPFA